MFLPFIRHVQAILSGHHLHKENRIGGASHKSTHWEAQGIKKASNSRYTLLSGARSYQHKAVGELHRQKIALHFSATSIDMFLLKLQAHHIKATTLVQLTRALHACYNNSRGAGRSTRR